MKWLRENAFKISVLIYALVSFSLLLGFAFSGFNNILLFKIWYLGTGIIAVITLILMFLFLFKLSNITHIKNKFKDKKEKRK